MLSCLTLLSVIAVGAKAPRKQVGGSSSAASSFGSPTSSGSSRNKYAGGNPVKWWPSPKWQKGTKAKDTSDRERWQPVRGGGGGGQRQNIFH